MKVILGLSRKTKIVSEIPKRMNVNLVVADKKKKKSVIMGLVKEKCRTTIIVEEKNRNSKISFVLLQ